MNDFETVDVGDQRRLTKYWEAQWLIGYHSDTETGRWYHDRSVQMREAGAGA